jgi:hypothetical protein
MNMKRSGCRITMDMSSASENVRRASPSPCRGGCTATFVNTDPLFPGLTASLRADWLRFAADGLILKIGMKGDSKCCLCA